MNLQALLQKVVRLRLLLSLLGIVSNVPSLQYSILMVRQMQPSLNLSQQAFWMIEALLLARRAGGAILHGEPTGAESLIRAFIQLCTRMFIFCETMSSAWHVSVSSAGEMALHA